MLEPIIELLGHTGFSEVTWQMLVMWLIVAVLLYLAVYRKFEPLLLVPIAFGTLLANLPTEGIMEGLEFAGRAVPLREDGSGGLFYYLFQGIHLELFPPIIFMGVGALTDFGPLIANPRTMLLGAAAQFGVFGVFLAAYAMKKIGVEYSLQECGAISIIGGADGPTSIFLANKLAPHLLGPIAVAAYSYMALVPVIQPPIMRALTNSDERRIRMPKLRQVSRLEKLLFATAILMIGILVVPAAAPLLFMLFFGNFMRECGVVERLSKSAQNEIINIVTIFLGASVGITMHGEIFLTAQTLGILALGVLAFAVATASGI
ncbi:MAG: sodium ion-translocating decarboxylase subunit beta, partial [Opitutales bacterium]